MHPLSQNSKTKIFSLFLLGALIFISGCFPFKKDKQETYQPPGPESMKEKTPYTTPSYGKTVDRIVAKVNEDIITLSEVQETSLPEVMEIKKKFTEPEKSMMIKEAEKRALEALVEMKLQEQRAKARGIFVSEKDIDSAVEDVIKRNNFSEEDLKAILKQQGVSFDEYRERLREQILVSRVINVEIRSKILVTDEEIKEYYDKHRSAYLKQPEAEISQILFFVSPDADDDEVRDIKTMAEDVLKKIRKGTDFAEMARKYSEDPSAKNGGYLGIIKKGEMIPALEKAAFSLKQGEVSDLIRTNLGFHIIRVEKKQVDIAEPLEEVQEEIRQKIFREKMKAKMDAWLEELREGAVIDMFL